MIRKSRSFLLISTSTFYKFNLRVQIRLQTQQKQIQVRYETINNLQKQKLSKRERVRQ